MALLIPPVVTVIGPDRLGIVSAVSDKAVEFGISWTDSLMANFEIEFAGIVQLQVLARRYHLRRRTGACCAAMAAQDA
ncbi:MAG: hypothetical protein H7232_12005 [Aeromicrobium sp.]|nr:hypothetical protein [Burkholderiales bacterium]